MKTGAVAFIVWAGITAGLYLLLCTMFVLVSN